MSDQVDRSVLPIRRPPFAGVADKTLGGSRPDWGLIGHVKPPAGAPNVLLVLIDDAGFGNPGTFGGPIETPVYDRMASQGLRYNRFHVTAIYDRGKASTVDATLTSAVRKSVAQVDGHGAKQLKAALADAQAGIGG